MQDNLPDGVVCRPMRPAASLQVRPRPLMLMLARLCTHWAYEGFAWVAAVFGLLLALLYPWILEPVVHGRQSMRTPWRGQPGILTPPRLESGRSAA